MAVAFVVDTRSWTLHIIETFFCFIYLFVCRVLYVFIYVYLLNHAPILLFTQKHSFSILGKTVLSQGINSTKHFPTEEDTDFFLSFPSRA